MKKILLLRGLPASGKSTFAKELVKNNPGVYKRVNKDDLRAMLDSSHWSKGNERFVLELRDHIVARALYEGKHVIVDDTNFAPKHEERMREIAKANDTLVEVKFFDTPLEDCIARDAKRENPVGKKVIQEMYDQYLKPEIPVIQQVEGAPFAVMCDLDGTLTHMDGKRSPYDYTKVDGDSIDNAVLGVLNAMSATNKILLVSGRESSCREATEKWLEKHAVPYDKLLMRTEGDFRKDDIVKRELYEQNIAGKYNVTFVLDDRDRVVKMWRSLGLKCLQVQEGAF